MSAFDGSLSDVDADESQATQLIQAALEKSPEPSESRGRSTTTAQNGDTSIDSFPSSKNSGANPIRQYHFHGLAATQTDTQLDDDENDANSGLVPSEGSQKENLGAAAGKTGKDIKWGMPSPDSQSSSPHRLSIKDNVTMGERSMTPGRVAKPKPPTVTFQSPIKSPMPSKPIPQSTPAKGKLVPQSSRQWNGRSHSPALSEDSFAQGDTQLEDEHFLVTSKKFTTPLADLVRGDDEISSEVSRQTEISYISHSSRTVVRDKDDRPPVILVPSTPSQSGSSDNSKEETPLNRFTPIPQDEGSFERGQRPSRMVLDSDSNKSSQHSQGYDGQEEVAEVENLYSDMRSTRTAPQRSLPVHQDTFPETQLATQAATQVEHFVPATPSVVPQTNTSTYTHTGPRSLLSTMDPSKRSRYQHLVQPTPASPISPVPRQFPAGSSRMTASGAETQPSVIPEQRIPAHPRPILPPVHVPSPHKPSPKKPVHRQALPPPSVDAMDVVPDSEPMREQVLSPVLEKQPPKVTVAGSQSHNSSRVTKRLSNDSEVTEDSDAMPAPKKIAHREEEEEEEEGPGDDDKRMGEKVEERDKEPGRVEDDDDDDDDDDEPLSARLQKGKGKVLAAPLRGKPTGAARTYTSKSKAEKRPKKAPVSGEVRQPVRQQKGAKNAKPASADTSTESAVPSSVPHQDHPLVPSRKPSLKVVATAKEKESKVRGKSSRATSVARSTRSGRSATVEAEEDGDVNMEAVSDSERATEIAIDEEGDNEEEEYMEPEALQQNLKRKRGRPPKSKSMNQAIVTPRTRLNKRLKSAGSTMSRLGATRVIAQWKQSNLWYSGIIHEHLSGNTYTVKFDDGLEESVSTEHMRSNNLRAGDLVRFGKKNKDFKVVKVNHKSNVATIDFGDGKDDVEFKDIGIPTRIINSAWQDRLLDHRTVVPVIRNVDVKVKPTPSPSRSTASFLSLNTNAKGPRQSYKFLQKVGLIVTLGSNTNDRTEDGKSRSDILSAVRDSGGVVIDDLFKYLKMDISYSPNRWVIERDAVQWVGEPKELQRLFLLADNYNLKPKYLMALALGIPCLSIKWLYACLDAGKELDWRPYLLPQGRPTVLESVTPSQQIDLNWGERPEHLFDIMENPVASRLLEGQSVLCSGPDMTPRGKDVDKASFIVRIILAMGATRVEAVHDISYAAQPLSQYNLLILREKEQYTRDCLQTHTVDWNWIKDSLIMSRRLAYPTWLIDEDSQCSQSL